LLGSSVVALVLLKQGPGQQGPLIGGEAGSEFYQHRIGLGGPAAGLQHIGQEQADRQGFGFELGFAGPVQGRLQLRLGQGVAARFHLQQRQQLQALDLVWSQVEQLAHFPLGAAEIFLIASQFSQQQSQGPPLGLLIGQSLQQSRGLSFAIQANQQLQKPLLLGRAGFAQVEPLLQIRDLTLE